MNTQAGFRPSAVWLVAIGVLAALLAWLAVRPEAPPPKPPRVVDAAPTADRDDLDPTLAPLRTAEADFEALNPTDHSVRCDVRLHDGAYRFVRLEAFGASLRRVEVKDGVLTAITSVDAGEGDLADAEGAVGRIHWETSGSEQARCTLAPVPVAAVSGDVLSFSGRPVKGALVAACGQKTTTDAQGAFRLDLAAGKQCTLRVVHGASGAVPPQPVMAPQEVSITLGYETVPLAVVDRELEVVEDRLGQLIAVQEQLLKALPDAGADAALLLEHHRAKRAELQEVRKDTDPDRRLEAWATLE